PSTRVSRPHSRSSPPRRSPDLRAHRGPARDAAAAVARQRPRTARHAARPWMKALYHHRTQGRRVEGVHIRGVANALRELGCEVRVISFPGADPEAEPVPVPARTTATAKDPAAPPAATGDGKGRLAGLVSRLPGVLFEFAEIGYNLVTWWRIRAEIAR